jgi:hypothetical protein
MYPYILLLKYLEQFYKTDSILKDGFVFLQKDM